MEEINVYRGKALELLKSERVASTLEQSIAGGIVPLNKMKVRPLYTKQNEVCTVDLLAAVVGTGKLSRWASFPESSNVCTA